MIRLAALCALVALLSGCAGSPPTKIDNICHIFDEKRSWYRDVRDAQKRWDGSIAVKMSMMHQESSFESSARPPRRRLLGFIPWRRPSTAYGYAQAKNTTWAEYRMDSGNRWASRADFGDAIDFVGWYNHMSRRRSGIAEDDAYNLYLAYHEGHAGFNRGSYQSKGWLVEVARRVDRRAERYEQQLRGCEQRLRRSWWWPF